MTTCYYPMPNWLEESFKLYNQDFEKKLEKLSGSFGYRIMADPAWAIDKDVFMIMVLDAGKLKNLAICSEQYCKENAEYIMGATLPVWKKILTKKDKFVGAFMGGRVKLEKGNTVGALGLGPHANNLVDVLTQVDLKFSDELSPAELAEFKSKFEAARAKLAV